MAVVLVEGFDTYNGIGANTGLAAKWTLNGTPSMVTGRFSGQAARISQGPSQLHMLRFLPSTYNVFAHGVAFRASAYPGTNGISPSCNYESGGTGQFGWQIDSSGAIVVYRYTGNFTGVSLGSSAAGVILANTFHYIEVEALISATVGTVKVYVDGTIVANLSGLNNKNAGTTVMDSARFGGYGQYSAGQGYNQDIDDMYFTDVATKLGERRVETLYPTSDIAAGLTRSSGSTNFSLVNEAQANGDTSYVEHATVGTVDTYGLGDLSSTPATISAVQLSAFAEKTGASTKALILEVISGATTNDGSSLPLAASYGKYERLLLTDPNTSAAWTTSGVNALTGGPKVA